MQRPRWYRASGRLVLAVSLLAFSAVLAPTFASASAATPSLGPVGSSSGSIPAAAATLYDASFGTRAGFDGSYATLASHVAPATGTDLVVVTFYPRTPAFFLPPALGARPLTPSQIGNLYGLPASSYASAESYFESQGLNIVHTNPDRLSLTVEGSVASLERAFGTSIESGTYHGRAVTFPSQAPSLPSGLESSVSSVLGLSSGFDQFVVPEGLLPSPSSSGVTPAQTPDEITPAIARLIYQFSSFYNVSGSFQGAVGEGIVLLLWGDGYSPDDLNTFFSTEYPSTFPQPSIHPYPVDGAPAPSSAAVNDPSKAPQELTLDLEWSGSMAPGATLDAVYAPDGPASDNYSPTDASMGDAMNQAVTGISGVSVISMSFGTPENASAGLRSAWDTDFATASQEGITLLAATGDFGGDEGSNCQGGPVMDYPSSSPDVIAVGGTDPSLARNFLGQVTGLQGESAWSGSGGGFSGLYSAPSWQKVGNAAGAIAANGGGRGAPDVSAAATLNALYYAGEDRTAAGTSFATPLWAGLVGEMDATYGARLGFLTPRIYSVGASQEAGKNLTGLGDVVGGSTCIGTASAGWDPETGWGSPRALNLYEDLTATFVNLTVSASPSPVAPGGTVTLVASLTNLTSGKPLVGVPVTLSLSASDSNGPCAGEWGSETANSNASGGVSFSVAVPACYFGSHGNAQATVTSDGYYGTSSATVDVNLLGFVPALAGIEQFPANLVAYALIMGIGAVIGYYWGLRKPVLPPQPQRTRVRRPARSGPTVAPTGPAVAPTGPAVAPTGPTPPPSPETTEAPPTPSEPIDAPPAAPAEGPRQKT